MAASFAGAAVLVHDVGELVVAVHEARDVAVSDEQRRCNPARDQPSQNDQAALARCSVTRQSSVRSIEISSGGASS